MIIDSANDTNASWLGDSSESSAPPWRGTEARGGLFTMNLAKKKPLFEVKRQQTSSRE